MLGDNRLKLQNKLPSIAYPLRLGFKRKLEKSERKLAKRNDLMSFYFYKSNKSA